MAGSGRAIRRATTAAPGAVGTHSSRIRQRPIQPLHDENGKRIRNRNEDRRLVRPAYQRFAEKQRRESRQQSELATSAATVDEVVCAYLD